MKNYLNRDWCWKDNVIGVTVLSGLVLFILPKEISIDAALIYFFGSAVVIGIFSN